MFIQEGEEAVCETPEEEEDGNKTDRNQRLPCSDLRGTGYGPVTHLLVVSLSGNSFSS